MSRPRENGANNPESLSTEGASRAAFTARLQMILQHWPSADRLARAMGVSPSAFRKWLRGEAEPSRERLVALADAAKVGVAWLAKGEGPAPALSSEPGTGRSRSATGPEHQPGAEQFLLLPQRVETAAAGTVAVPPPHPDTEYVAFRHDWVRSALGVDPSHVIMEVAVGESMLPTIHHGDLLLVDTTDRNCSSFGIYVLEISGERLVKRVQRKLDGSLVLISDNETYQPDAVAGDLLKNVSVIGRVIWAGGAI